MKIIETRHWNTTDIRRMCIRENLYTRGDCEDYDAMFDIVRDHRAPTMEDIYRVADDINRHSEGQTVENIMYMLVNDVVKSTFEIDDSTEPIYKLIYWLHNQSKMFSEPQVYVTVDRNAWHEAIGVAVANGYDIEFAGEESTTAETVVVNNQ